ncbi:hypothetical protein D3C76_262840 [compost metagenome]
MSRFPWKNTSEDIANQRPSQWETPSGAQEKANKAEQNAKDYTDAHSEAGAEINQNAYSVVNGIQATSKTDSIDIEAGTGIIVTPVPTDKKVRITAGGTSIPGLHGAEHVGHGADPIPEATLSVSGLMSPSHVAQLADLSPLWGNPYTTKKAMYLKGQLHCHTTNSDGVDSPTGIVTAYKNAGYHFVAITDHAFVTPDPMVSGVTFIQSAEELDGTGHGHIPSYNIASLAGSTCHADVMNYHRKNGSLVSCAHPRWYDIRFTDADLRNLNYNFIEIYNAIEDIEHDALVDELYNSGKRFYLTAVDDCHDKTGSHFNKGYVVVNANTNSLNDIMDALRHGNFISSTGNDLDITTVGSTLTATCTETSKIEFIANNKVVQSIEGTTTSYTLKGDERYLRVRATRISDNKKAWSNPIFFGLPSSKLPQKNHAYNGNFDIWQSGDAFSQQGYAADMLFLSSNFQSFKLERLALNDSQGNNGARITATARGTGSDLAAIQALSSLDSQIFKGSTVTFSVLLRRNNIFTGGNIQINIYSGTGTDEWNISTGRVRAFLDINPNDLDIVEFKRFKVNMTVPIYSNQIGYLIRCNGEVIDGSYLEIRQCKLSFYEDVPIFELPDVEREKLKCMTFYEKSSPDGIPANNSSGRYTKIPVFGGMDNVLRVHFKVQKRKVPIARVYNLGTANSMLVSGSNTTVSGVTSTQNELMMNSATIGSVNTMHTGEFDWEADARFI